MEFDLTSVLPGSGSGLFSGLLQLLQQNQLEAAMVLAFLSIVLIVSGGQVMLRGRGSPLGRLNKSAAAAVGPGGPSGGAPSLRFAQNNAGWLKRFEPLYAPLLPKDDKRVTAVRQSLVQAGFMHPSAVRMYFAIKVLQSLVFGGLVIVLAPILMRSLEINAVLMIAVFAMLLGYMIPVFYMSKRTARRKRQIRDGFPDALDMLLVCVEAGLGLDSALQRMGREIERVHPLIADQFRLVGNELRAGKSRAEALRGLGERTGVDDVRALVTLLIQSDELGTSIGQALRVHAFEMRTKRMLRAEEKAHKIPVKMAFPLTFGLVPVVMSVTLTPGILKIVTFLLPMLAKSQGGY